MSAYLSVVGEHAFNPIAKEVNIALLFIAILLVGW
jgi:hypothetical protein